MINWILCRLIGHKWTYSHVPAVGLKGQFDSDPKWQDVDKNNPAFLTFDPVELPNGEYYVLPPHMPLGTYCCERCLKQA